MSKRLIGVILVITGILAFHLLGSQPETSPIWIKHAGMKNYSSPVSSNGHAIFISGQKSKRKYKLTQVDNEGNIEKSIELPILPHPPISFRDKIVVSDKGQMIRGFSVPGLKLLWESGSMEPQRFPPLKINSEHFLIQSTKNLLFCLDSKTGQPVWSKQFNDNLISFSADQVITCIHGYTDVKKPAWKITALNKEDGEELWTFNGPVSPEPPFFYQNVCIHTNSEGQVLFLNQFTGEQIYKNEVSGLRITKILENKLILLSSGGSRIVCLSLITGNSWTTTLQSGFVAIAKAGNKLIIVDKKSVRAVDADSGTGLWSRNLEDVYNAFAFRKGIFVTHKDSFFSRTTYGSYIDGQTGRTKWVSYGKGIFYKPLIMNKGDLLVSYPGDIKLIPKPQSAVAQTYTPKVSPKVPDIDPMNTDNFWKKKSSKDQKQPAAAPPKKKNPIDIDPGWKTNK